MRPERQHPRRGRHRPPVIRPHATSQPPVDDVSRETSEEVARLELLAAADEAPPPLSKDRIAKLEALTAIWMREVRVGGPGPEDTLLYSAPKPPPPPRPEPAIDLVAPLQNDPRWHDDAAKPPRVVRDWSSRHDERSRGFDVSDRIKVRVPIQDRLWECGPVFDQGTTPPLSLRDASGCVGMAVAAAGNVLLLASANPYVRLDDAELLNRDAALRLYDRAQELDHVTGTAYAGTSVLAGMKAGQEAGLWDSYLWAFGTRDIAQALLQVGPVVIGIPWSTGLEDPDPSGVIKPSGSPAGGHALALVGILASRPGGPWFVAQQSRGEQLGDRGRVLIHHKHLAGLLAGVGEAAIPVPPGGVQ